MSILRMAVRSMLNYGSLISLVKFVNHATKYLGELSLNSTSEKELTRKNGISSEFGTNISVSRVLSTKCKIHFARLLVRDEIEQLMDDNRDMAEMYLTEKKSRMELSCYGDQSLLGYKSTDGALSLSAPFSHVSSPPGSRRLEKSLSIARIRHESMRSLKSGAETQSIEELEMLLETYFVVIDNSLNKLTSLKEYIDDTEDFINIQLGDLKEIKEEVAKYKVGALARVELVASVDVVVPPDNTDLDPFQTTLHFYNRTKRV
ncbi:Magnesium transporter MRS2-B [Capsicum chinense]|nr:Magnesium transporter MRS2-B [Capsicum chinense]